MNCTWDSAMRLHPNYNFTNEQKCNESFQSAIDTMTQRDSMAVVIPITVCYAIIFVAGVLGNVITSTVISRNKSMHTATNYYLFDLAVSDLMLLLSGMPNETYSIWFPGSYPLNQSFCILQGLLSETSTNATVLTITSFTIERYIAIWYPFMYVQLFFLNICYSISKIPQQLVFDFADISAGKNLELATKLQSLLKTCFCLLTVPVFSQVKGQAYCYL